MYNFACTVDVRTPGENRIPFYAPCFFHCMYIACSLVLALPNEWLLTMRMYTREFMYTVA